jgi:spore coat protein H
MIVRTSRKAQMTLWLPFLEGSVQGWLTVFGVTFAIAFLALGPVGCNRDSDGTHSTSTASEPARPNVLVSPPRQAPAASADPLASEPADDFKLATYELKMKARDLASLEDSGFSNETFPATFIAGGKTFEGVQVRCRGSWSRSWPKKSLKISFKKDDRMDGEHCVNLNSGWRDPAFVREPLAYHIYAACGVPAPKSRMVRLMVNGSFHGLYIEVEQPEKPLLSRYELKGASLYKAISKMNQADERQHSSEASYARHYERASQKDAGLKELQTFCGALAHSQEAYAFFNANIDLDKYINYLAASALLQHWDSFNKNHYLAFDEKGSKKWFVIPWDLDRTLGDHWNQTFGDYRLPVLLGTQQMPGITGWNRMEDRFLNDPKLRARFLDRLSELLQTEFTPEKLFPILDKLEAEIAKDADRDRRQWPSPTPDLHTGIAGVKTYIKQRRAFLLAEIPKLR